MTAAEITAWIFAIVGGIGIIGMFIVLAAEWYCEATSNRRNKEQNQK